MKKTLVFASLMFSLFTAPALLAEVVNINKADVATLDSLDGIGEKKAEAIIAYRTEHGEFKTLEELKEVPGIGDKMFEKIKADISLTDAAATVADKPAEDATAKTATAEDKPEAKADAKAEKAPAKDAKTESADKADKVSDKEAAKAGKS